MHPSMGCFFGELVANCLINSVADGTTLPGIKKARGTKLMFLNLRISLLIFSNFKCIVVFLASFASSGHKLALEFKYFLYKKVLLSLNHLLWCQDQRRHQCWLNFNVIGYVKHYLRQRFFHYCSACVYVRSFHSWANGLLLNFLHNVCLQLTCGGFVFAAFLIFPTIRLFWVSLLSILCDVGFRAIFVPKVLTARVKQLRLCRIPLVLWWWVRLLGSAANISGVHRHQLEIEKDHSSKNFSILSSASKKRFSH